MPFLSLTTNVAVDSQQTSELLKEMTAVVASATGKSEHYIMTAVESGKAMMFAGSAEPLAYLKCKSIGLSSSQAKSLSPAIAHLLKNTLNIPAERIYIEFSNCPGEFWGWNGGTFG